MLQKKDFYRIKEIKQVDSGKYEIDIFLNKDHEIFEGHFPGNPVTPGACMIQIVKELTAEILGYKIAMKSTSNVKFMALINPDLNPDIRLDLVMDSEDPSSIKVKNTASFGDTVALKMSNVYNKVEG